MNYRNRNKLIDWLFVGAIFVVIGLLSTAAFFRFTGDLAVCRNYYKEMGLAECYFSSKTVRVPNGK